MERAGHRLFSPLDVGGRELPASPVGDLLGAELGRGAVIGEVVVPCGIAGVAVPLGIGTLAPNRGKLLFSTTVGTIFTTLVAMMPLNRYSLFRLPEWLFPSISASARNHA